MRRYKEIEQQYLLTTYRRNDLMLVRGRGKYVWDFRRRRFLDFFSGLGVNNLGHAYPAVVTAIRRQAGRLLHVSNLYYTAPQLTLARLLSRRTLGGRVFFCNSGAESTETALKISRKFGGGVRNEVIVFENSFHGRTLGALSATAQTAYQDNFKPLVPGFVFARFNDIESVKQRLSERTAAILLEPIQGEGGVHVADAAFIRELAAIARERRILLIFDEVQCGLGRTGRLCAYEHYGVKPDILCMAKGLGGGLSLGAVVVQPALNEVFTYGDHGSTFGGNPVSCAAGIAVMRALTPARLKAVRALGDYLIKGLSRLAADMPAVKEIRGRGLMAAIQLDRPAPRVVALAQEKGILINCIKESIIRLLPPFIITRRDIDLVLGVLRDVIARI